MRRLGNYTLTHRLGAGGMGEVWMGRRESLGGAARDVAIKLLPAERASNTEAREMLLAEARLSMLLHHSNIVHVHDIAEAEDKTCYMVMEFVEGLTLAELTERMRKAGQPMPDVLIAFIVGEVLKGLAHAHELRNDGQVRVVVHRDVSPQNVLLSVFGEVKIMDFGIARLASEETSGLYVKGKLRYMPPEQLRGESREPTLDLFAVGAMLHELLDGVKFRSAVIDEARLYGMILDGQVPPLQRPLDSIPKELDELRRMLLAANPSERIQSARQAFRQLTRWPGYRDTHFEIDELVRYYVGQEEPRPEPTTAIGPSSTDEATYQHTRGLAESSATALLSKDASETDISRAPARQTASNLVVPPPAKLLSMGLAFFGLAFVFVGAAFLFEIWSDQDADNTEEVGEKEPVAVVPEREDPPPPTEPAVEEEVVAPKLDVGQSEIAKIETDVPTLPVDEPEGSPKPKPVKKTEVTLGIRKGIFWAQLDIAGKTHKLEGKSVSTRLSPGSHTASCRTKVGGEPKTARVKIPAGKAAIWVEKNCNIVVE